MKYPEEELISDGLEVPEEEEEEKPEITLTKEERRWIALGALKSTLMIASVYLIGAALLIWLMLAIWT